MAENKAPEIDLSKISNVDAATKKDKQMKEVIKSKSSSKKKSNKFNFSEPERVELPSGGFLYESVTSDEDILNGFIYLYPMTAKEEEILSTSRFIKDGTVTRRVLDRCIASDIDAKDILLYDSTYLLFFLRQISYGDDYEFELTCQNSMCEKKFDYSMNISELTFEELPKNFEEPIKIVLPKSKYTVYLVLPRLFHSEEIVNMGNKKKMNVEDSSTSQIDRYVATTLTIEDKDGEEVPKRDWVEFYEALVGMDIAYLREKSDVSNGVDTLDNVSCPYCGADYSGTIPIDINFFRF